MPGPLTYAAITLMARDRVRQIREALLARINDSAANNEIERQVFYLADKAYGYLSGTDNSSVPSPLRMYGPLVDNVSKFSLVGAIGPDIPRYSALFANGQAWLGDTLHKGTPDANKEQVLVRSVDLVLEFWTRVQPLLRDEFSDSKAQARALSAMRAYVLGHMCHIAADVIVNPYLDDAEWLSATAPNSRMTRDQVIGALEAGVSDKIMRPGNTDTRTGEWADWWPSAGQIPSSFYKALKGAIEAIYGTGGIRKGFGEYEAQRQSDSPPALSEGLLKDGYSTFRTVVQIGRAWDFLDWMGVTAPMFIPALLALPIAAALPAGKDLFRKTQPAGYNKDVGKYEFIAFPFAVTSIVPLVVTFFMSFSYVGASKAVVFAWVSAAVQITAAIAFFASLGGAGAGRWIPIVIVPLLLELVQIIFVLVSGHGNNRFVQLALGSIFHLALSGFFLVFYAAFLHKAVEGLIDQGAKSEAFWGYFGLWFLILGAIWMLSCILLRVLTRSEPNSQARDYVTATNHRVRLFDDTTLFREFKPSSPTLADLYYPSGRRKLLKIWWEGAGPATIQSQRDRLLFTLGGTARTVLAPTAPTTATDFGKFLERTVKTAANAIGLKTKLFYADDLDYELPAGSTFSDNTQQFEVDPAAPGAAVPLAATEAGAYVLYHAVKPQQAITFDTTGPSVGPDLRPAAAGTGGITAGPLPNQVVAAGANTTLFTRFFRPGDIVVIPTPPSAATQQRTILSVDSDTQLTLSVQFSPALAAGGGSAYGRGAQDRRVDLTPAGFTVFSLFPPPPPAPALRLGPNDIAGAGGRFGDIFRPGDKILINSVPPQTRMVIAVMSDAQMTLSERLDPAIFQPGFSFTRLGEQPQESYAILANPDDTLASGDSVMNDAADLGALLCLGIASHLMPDGDRDHAQVGTPNGLNKVFQVFRNWNLDRRRENEWRMIVLGGAVSEKRGNAAAADAALPPLPTDWTMFTSKGEVTANQLGWLPTLRAWLEMASRPGADTKSPASFRPGNPSNLALSRAMAYLLEMRDPDPAAP